MTTEDIRAYGPATTIEAILADAILDRIFKLEGEVTEGFQADADDVWEAAEGGDARATYRAGMIFKAAIDDESGIGYGEKVRLAVLANAVTYSALERM